MPETIPQDSVGLVQPQTLHVDQPLELECGRVLPSYDLVYETYGTLNADASNAVLLAQGQMEQIRLLGEEERHAQARLAEMQTLIEQLTKWYDDVKHLETEQLATLLNLGAKVTRLLDAKDRIVSLGRKRTEPKTS